MYARSSDFDEDEAIPRLPTATREATTPPVSLRTSISPPPARIRATEAPPRPLPQRKSEGPAADLPHSAALEAGLASILPDQQLQYWSTHLAKHIDPSPTSPLLPIPAFRNLYARNAAPAPNSCHRGSGGPHAPSSHNGGGGKHFVIHQHDHPVAGLHYDLRLQINGTSSVSWAIMYGLPGDPNSKARVNRNATETRVHCLWNHLIETASAMTGSMLIWDTGEYEVLPYYSNTTAREPETSSDDDDDGINDDDDSEKTLARSENWRDHMTDNPRQRSSCSAPSEQEKLHQSFQHRKIRLRLHGTRLPKNYTITLRLSASAPDFPPPPSQSISSSRKRKRKPAAALPETPQTTPPPPTSDTDTDTDDDDNVTAPDPEATQRKLASDTATRLTNAYPGATNSIRSVYQRPWYLSLDRAASGFDIVPVRGGPDPIPGDHDHGRRSATQWIRRRSSSRRQKGNDGGGGGSGSGGEGRHRTAGFEPFYVLGRDVERSVVTGRTAGQVMRDEGVEGFVSRRGWRGKV